MILTGAVLFCYLIRHSRYGDLVCLWSQMETAKKTYHLACKEEKLAATREATAKAEASVAPDQQKKLHEKVEKCKQDAGKVSGEEISERKQTSFLVLCGH